MDEYQTTPDTWQDSCGRLGRGNNTTGRLSNIWSAVPVAYCFLLLFGKNNFEKDSKSIQAPVFCVKIL